jgi:hypothetical protein
VETRRESNPSGGFADRLSPGEPRAALSAGVEPAAADPESAVPSVALRELECQPQESNLPCRSHGFTDRSHAVSGHAGIWGDRRVTTPLRPAGFTARLLATRFGHRAQRRNRTSVPWVLTRRSPIELAEPARSRRDLNPQSLDS